MLIIFLVFLVTLILGFYLVKKGLTGLVWFSKLKNLFKKSKDDTEAQE